MTSTEAPGSPATSTRATRLTRAGRWLLFGISLAGVVVLIGRYELQAGEHAGFGVLAWVVPLVLGPYVLWTWTDPTASWWDELGAVALLLGSVGLSVATSDRPLREKLTAAGIGVVVILVDWRIVVRWRASRAYADLLAAAERTLAEAHAAAAGHDLVVAELRTRLAAAVAAAAVPPPPPPPPAAAPPWGTTLEDHVIWLRETIADSVEGAELTGRDVRVLMGLGSDKAGRDRLALARKPRAVA